MATRTLVEFVQWIDGNLEVPEECRDEISPVDFIWYRCLKNTGLVSVEKYSDSTKEELTAKFEEWQQLCGMDELSEIQETRKRELEDYANNISNANEDDMGCKTLWETQEDMGGLEKQIEERIGYRDDQGKRKLKPELFLSGERAAYTIIRSWNKRMSKGQVIASEGDLSLLKGILELVEFPVSGNFEDGDIGKYVYQGLTESLWLYLLHDKYEKGGIEFKKMHREIFEIALLIDEEKNGVQPQESIFVDNDTWGNPYNNPRTIANAYWVVRDFIMPLSREEAISRFAEWGKDLEGLNKRHYNLFL